MPIVSEQSCLTMKLRSSASSKLVLSRTADRQAIHLDRWHSHTYWYGLSILAASSDALIEREVVADHRHAGQHVGAISDQGCVLHRSGNLAVFNQVGL